MSQSFTDRGLNRSVPFVRKPALLIGGRGVHPLPGALLARARIDATCAACLCPCKALPRGRLECLGALKVETARFPTHRFFNVFSTLNRVSTRPGPVPNDPRQRLGCWVLWAYRPGSMPPVRPALPVSCCVTACPCPGAMPARARIDAARCLAGAGLTRAVPDGQRQRLGC